MSNVENKYKKATDFDDTYNVYKDHSSHMTDQTTDQVKNVNAQIKALIERHPIEFIAILSVSTTVICYKLYQRLLTNAIFKANKRTLEYVANNFKVYRVEL